MSTEEKKSAEGYGTTGHEWDGIEEWNNPLPRWWVWVFYATIIWGIGYTIAYPAWPLLKEATPGLLGYSTRAKVEAEIKRFDEMNAPVEAALVSAELTDIPGNAELMNYSVNAGGAMFQTYCSQCHGSGAAGVQSAGYPNLLDDDWLWGGTIEDIHYTIEHGIRNATDEEARFSEMPAFGRDGLLGEEEIAQVVQYVRKLSGQEHDAALAGPGETVFLDNCAACHMDDGTGDRFQGAPNLTDAIWLYGGSEEAITETVTNARYGIMPAKGGAALSEADVRALAAYVHQLGGGE